MAEKVLGEGLRKPTFVLPKEGRDGEYSTVVIIDKVDRKFHGEILRKGAVSGGDFSRK